jgi:plastocyanin
MKKIGIAIGAAAVVIVIIIVVMMMGMNKPNGSSATGTTTQSSSGDDVSSAVATITYSDNGFSPATTTVKSGDTVAVKNTASSELDLDSDPHPVHTDDTDLNVGAVASGQTKTFVVTKTGSFGFHNHLDPSKNGKIEIQ